MKNFKKLIKEAYLGNPLNEEAVIGTPQYYVKYTTQDGEDAKSQIYNSEEEADKKEKKLVDSGVKKSKVVKVNEELLKEFTLPGGDYGDSYANRLPEEQLTSTDDYEVFMEMFPQGEASRILMDPNRKKH